LTNNSAPVQATAKEAKPPVNWNLAANLAAILTPSQIAVPQEDIGTPDQAGADSGAFASKGDSGTAPEFSSGEQTDQSLTQASNQSAMQAAGLPGQPGYASGLVSSAATAPGAKTGALPQAQTPGHGAVEAKPEARTDRHGRFANQESIAGETPDASVAGANTVGQPLYSAQPATLNLPDPNNQAELAAGATPGTAQTTQSASAASLSRGDAASMLAAQVAETRSKGSVPAAGDSAAKLDGKKKTAANRSKSGQDSAGEAMADASKALNLTSKAGEELGAIAAIPQAKTSAGDAVSKPDSGMPKSSHPGTGAIGAPGNRTDQAANGFNQGSSDQPARTVNGATSSSATGLQNAPVAFEGRLRQMNQETEAASATQIDTRQTPAALRPLTADAAQPFARQAPVGPHVSAINAASQDQVDDSDGSQAQQGKSNALTKGNAAGFDQPSPAERHGETQTAFSSTATVPAQPANVSATREHAPVQATEHVHAPALPEAEPARVQPLANNIRIALDDNGQRVELRLSERAGDIHVAVRTPDSQLAESLRGDLPSLSSKLEQSGYHSEMWKPTHSTSSEMRLPNMGNSNLSSDTRQQSGGRQQDEGSQQQQQNPKNPQQQTLNRKTDRKEFSWLFQSIR
jgi:hypothetical protein